MPRTPERGPVGPLLAALATLAGEDGNITATNREICDAMGRRVGRRNHTSTSVATALRSARHEGLVAVEWSSGGGWQKTGHSGRVLRLLSRHRD